MDTDSLHHQGNSFFRSGIDRTMLIKYNLNHQTVSYYWEPISCYQRFQLVGEFYYQSAFKKLVENHGDRGAYFECLATLIPENTNAFDNQAVRIDIKGMTVGYFNRNDARRFRIRLNTKKLTGQITSCNAVIEGGRLLNDGQHTNYSVSLAINQL